LLGSDIKESLTQKRKLLIKRLANLRKAKKIPSCSSYDGKLFYTLPTEPRKKVELRLTNPDEQLLNFDERPAHQTLLNDTHSEAFILKPNLQLNNSFINNTVLRLKIFSQRSRIF